MPSSHQEGLGLASGPKVALWGAILRLSPAKYRDHAHIMGYMLCSCVV